MRNHLFPLSFVGLGLLAGSACDDTTIAESGPPVDLKSPSASVSISLAPFEIRVLDGAGNPILRTISGSEGAYGTPGATRDEGIDNVAILPGWDAFVPDERGWTHPAAGKLLSQTPTKASFELEGEGGVGTMLIDVELGDARVILTTTAKPLADARWNKLAISFALPADEHFFGLGERYASVDHRGLSMYSWAEEGALGKGEGAPVDNQNPYPNGPSMTYFPVPFFHSNKGYAVHLATTYRTETHFGSEKSDAWRVAVNDQTLKTVIYVNPSPLAILDAWTKDTGRPFVPASWVFGPRRRVSNGYVSNPQGIEDYKMLRQTKVPTTGVDDAVHFLPHRSELGREDELKQWVKNAHALGYKVMNYNNPYISTSRPEAAEDLAYGKANDLFAKTPEGTIGETFFISGVAQNLATIDLTNPAGVAWFQELLKRSLAFGYDGWMHDFGEYVRRPWKFHDGRNGEAVHNDFPVLSAKAAHDLLVKERPDDFLFFVRSGYTGTQAYVPAVWGGDPEATFDDTQGIPAMLRGGINLGLVGVPLWGSDVTGFKCLTDFPNDKEMYLRWAQLGAVSPIMMEQNACSNPVGGARVKWKLWNDQETVDVYAAAARLHTRLAPYFERLIRDAHDTGVPIMRHPFLYEPKEPEVWKIDSAFFLGGSLWASPVVKRGAVTKEGWIPSGKWVDIADFTVYDGGKHVTIPAPLGKLPLLLKDGGIVPMLDASIETLAPATDPTVVTIDQVKDRLDVLVALSAGKDAKFVLADGTTLEAKRAAAPGAPSALATASPEDVATCKGLTAEQGCVNVRDEGGVSRLRITSALATEHTIVHDDVTVTAKGPSARRIRWDVSRLR